MLSTGDLRFQFRHIENDDFPPLHFDNSPIDESPQVARNKVAHGADLCPDLLIGLLKRKLSPAPRTDAIECVLDRDRTGPAGGLTSFSESSSTKLVR